MSSEKNGRQRKGWRAAAICLGVVLGLGWLGGAGSFASQDDPEADLLEMDARAFTNPTKIDNSWWPIIPGMQHVYEGATIEDGEKVEHRIVETVTDLTKEIGGVRTVVILEEDYSEGELIEREIAFHAQDDAGNVWHFGQLRETYDEVEFVGGRVWVVGHPQGAKAGIRMWAKPELGMAASQGYAPAPFNWTDRGRVYQMGQKTQVAAGSYEDVLVVEEWDAETPKGVYQLKYYAPGVGLVRIGYRGPDPEKEEMELVRSVELGPAELAEAREKAVAVEARAYIYSQLPPAEVMGSGASE